MPIGAKLYESAKSDEDGDSKNEESEDKKKDEPVEGEVVDEKDDKKEK